MEFDKSFSKSLLRKIDKHDVISFDLFDTLIKRDVKKPSDVFMLIQNAFENSLAGYQFTEEREHAYLRAYKKLGAKCTIDDIYLEIKGINNQQKVLLKNFEIELEKNICCRNEQIFGLFRYAFSRGKKVIIITDMYLSKDVIEQILKRCDIYGYEKLFISSEYGKSKIDGRLFDECCKELGILNSQLFHIGDGWKNDIIRARLKLISGYHVHKYDNLDYNSFKRFNEIEQLKYSVQQTVISNHLHICENDIEKLGFQTIGPMVYGFCLWLRKELNTLGVKKIYFLAREGLFIKKTFEMLFDETDLESHYLYASRRSFVIPSYWINPEYESVILSIAKSSYVTVQSMLQRWGLDPESYMEDIASCGLEINDIIDGRKLLENVELRNLYNKVKNDVIKNSKMEFALLRDYLKQEVFVGDCAIVDIGWNGAMQKAMEKILPYMEQEITLHGFYFGINSKNLGSELQNVHGYLYEQDKNEINRFYIYSFAGPLELSFTAPHETTIGYQRKEDKITPVFGKGEYILADGTLSDELKYTVLVQKGALKFVSIMKQYLNLYSTIESEVAFRNCMLFGLMPLNKHIDIFKKFEAKDLGQVQHFVNVKYKKLYGEQSIKKGFWNSTWKSGYMKAIFKLPIPYYKLYVEMRKRKD